MLITPDEARALADECLEALAFVRETDVRLTLLGIARHWFLHAEGSLNTNEGPVHITPGPWDLILE